MARPIAKDHDDKRRNILEIAAKVFARNGISRASMSEVARACGISKANIYHYYASKDDLLFDILDTYLVDLRDMIVEADRPDAPAEDNLLGLCTAFLLAYEGMDNEHKIQSEGLPLLPAEKQEALRAHQRDLVRIVARTLKDCAPDALADTSKCRDVTMSVFGMLNWFYMWHPKASKDDRVAYAKTVAQLTIGGLSKV